MSTLRIERLASLLGWLGLACWLHSATVAATTASGSPPPPCDTASVVSMSAASAAQSSTQHGGVAERAIDGNANANWDSGSCTFSTNSTDAPWWKVTVPTAQPLQIARVDVTNRDYDSLSGFDLDVNGERCASDNQVGDGETTQVACETTAGSSGSLEVRITRSGHGVLTICEVVVWACAVSPSLPPPLPPRPPPLPPLPPQLPPPLCDTTADCGACEENGCAASCYARACTSADAGCGGTGLLWAISDRGGDCMGVCLALGASCASPPDEATTPTCVGGLATAFGMSCVLTVAGAQTGTSILTGSAAETSGICFHDASSFSCDATDPSSHRFCPCHPVPAPPPPPPPPRPPLTADFANGILDDFFAAGEVSWEAGTAAVEALGDMVIWLAPEEASDDGNATDPGEAAGTTADREVKAAVLNAVNTVLDALGSLQETGAAPTVIASDALVMALEKRYPEDVAAAPFEIDTPGETRRRRRLSANNQSVDDKVVVGVPAEALGYDSSLQVRPARMRSSSAAPRGRLARPAAFRVTPCFGPLASRDPKARALVRSRRVVSSQAKMFLASGDVRGARAVPGLSLQGPTLSFTLKGDNGTINVSGTPKPIEISIPTTGHGKKVTVGESTGLSRFSNLQARRLRARARALAPARMRTDCCCSTHLTCIVTPCLAVEPAGRRPRSDGEAAVSLL